MDVKSRRMPPPAGAHLREIYSQLAAASRHSLRVLVIGNFGNGNIGDEAVLAGILAAMPSGVDVTVVSRNPSAVRTMHDVASVRTGSWASLRALLRCDVIGLGGGGIFGAGLPRLVALLPGVLLISRVILRKQLVVQALGVYLDTPPKTLSLLLLALRGAQAILVRDEESIQALAQLSAAPTGGPRPVLVMDPAVEVPVAPRSAAQSFLRQAGVVLDHAPLLVLSVKPAPDQVLTKRALEAVEQGVRWWLSAGGRAAVLPLSGQGDYGLGTAHSDTALARQLAAELPADCVTILPVPDSPQLAKAVIAEAAAVVAMRLHAQIFAWSTGVPCLGLVFEAKARAWHALTGACSIDLDPSADTDFRGWLSQTMRERALNVTAAETQ